MILETTAKASQQYKDADYDFLAVGRFYRHVQ